MANEILKKFPEELLNASSDERMRFFANCFVEHKNLSIAVDTAMRHITSPEPEKLIVVCGPSGIGKREFIREITRRISDPEEYRLYNIPGSIPIVSVEARAPEEGSFKFSSLWMDALKIMHEVRSGKRVRFENDEEEGSNGQKIITTKAIKADYQYILHRTLFHRHVKAFIINESQHMCRVATEKKANWSLDVIKSLANESETAIILVGTYDLLNILQASANFVDQIHQRTHIVDFARYHEYDPEEIQCFGKTAKRLINYMPFEEIDRKLVDRNWKHLYMYSLGRIGTLKRWFLRAYSYAIEQQAKSLSMDHLEATRNSGNQIKMELKAIVDGEVNLAKIRSDGDIKSSFVFYDQKDSKTEKKQLAKKSSKPFERKPTRDESHEGLINITGESIN